MNGCAPCLPTGAAEADRSLGCPPHWPGLCIRPAALADYMVAKRIWNLLHRMDTIGVSVPPTLAFAACPLATEVFEPAASRGAVLRDEAAAYGTEIVVTSCNISDSRMRAVIRIINRRPEVFARLLHELMFAVIGVRRSNGQSAHGAERTRPWPRRSCELDRRSLTI